MNNAHAYLPLTPQQFHILLALSGGDLHGYGMILEIAQRTRGELRLGTGTLYTALARLLEDGLILESGRRPAASQDDARRKYYRLTAFGRAVLQAEADRLESLVEQARSKGVPRGRRRARSR